MHDTPTAMRIPETMGPQEIGPYFRELREHFSLSPQDVSERLHIRVRYVTAMEEARYEAMPGKVYARGYVHTYAEFLGLDPDQVVAQCFPAVAAGAPAAAEEKPAQPAAAAKPKPAHLSDFKPMPPPLMRERQKHGRGRGLLIVGACALIALVAVQFSGTSSGEVPVEEESTVAEIPEALLASVRSTVMPQARNYPCLMGNLLLSCFYAGAEMQTIYALEISGDGARPYLAGIDLDSVALDEPLPVVEDEAAEDAESLEND